MSRLKEEPKATNRDDQDRPERYRGFSPEFFARNRAFITLVMNDFFLSYLLWLYHAFDGDVVMAIVLGTIAHHNVRNLVRQTGYDTHLLSEALWMPRRKATGLLPTNAFSVSEATGIPRETVRRKIGSLAAKGWIRRNRKGDLFVTPLPAKHFENSRYQLMNDLLEAADRIMRGCKEASPGQQFNVSRQ
jgi:hypothetical protein